MKEILCTIFGHWWKYFFSPSDSYSKRIDVRICKCCGKAQQYKRLISFTEKEEYIWMSMIGFTKLGAKRHHGKNIEG